MQVIENFYCQVNKVGFIATGDIKSPEFIVNTPSNRMQKITVTNLADEVIFQSQMPTEPWNYQSVKKAIGHLDLSDGANLYFGGEWIGCTEL